MKAAVVYEKGKIKLDDVDMLEPAKGQVLIKVEASGVCHSDINFKEGFYSIPLPAVPGHEGAGVVKRVGEGVDEFKEGDRVAITWKVYCGKCGMCLKGKVHLCYESSINLRRAVLPDGTKRLKSKDGKEIGHGFQIATLAQYTIVDKRSLVKIPENMPFQEACLLGCCVLTGIGAVVNTAKVEFGSSVAVIGLGGVGMNIIQGARLVGASKIIAVDLREEKLRLAEKFGATHFVNAGKEKVAEKIQEITNGGVDYCFEAVGSSKTMKLAYDSVGKGGKVVIVGVAPPNTEVTFSPFNMHIMEKAVIGCYYGSVNPRYDMMRIINLYEIGKVNLSDLITATYKMEEVEKAFKDCEEGKNVRGVVFPWK
jgi:S-(hydroxymethyl)glutathione dehydrogenase/alcohol dehydrogenase